MSKKTYIEPEEVCYPSGAMLRKGKAICPDGKIRTFIAGIPDTLSTIPARMKANGKTITGYVSISQDGITEGELVFTPYLYRKNAKAFR